MARHPATEGNDLAPNRVDAQDDVTVPDGQGGRLSFAEAVEGITAEVDVDWDSLEGKPEITGKVSTAEGDSLADAGIYEVGSFQFAGGDDPDDIRQTDADGELADYVVFDVEEGNNTTVVDIEVVTPDGAIILDTDVSIDVDSQTLSYNYDMAIVDEVRWIIQSASGGGIRDVDVSLNRPLFEHTHLRE